MSQSKVILVVDDEGEIRNIIQTNLLNKGYQVIPAVNGKHAVQKLESGQKVDLILCDWKMPMMTGLDVLKATRKLEAYSKTPFIMVTAIADKPAVIAAAKSGVTDYVVKPFKIPDLLAKISLLLGDPPQKPGDTKE